MIKKKLTDSSFIYLKIFLILVIVLIGAFLIFRGAKLIQESTFKKQAFTLLILSQKSYVVAVNNSTKTLAILSLEKDREKLSTRNKLKNSILLGIPINALIVYKNNYRFSDFDKEFFSFKNITSVAFDSFQHKLIDANALDIFKIYFSAKTVKEMNRAQLSVDSLSELQNKESLITNTFSNRIIFNEKNSIEVINRANVDGLATRVAKMLTHVGFNVISITSADEIPASKMIFRIDANNTTDELVQFFPVFSERKKDTGIADITIILGKDFAQDIAK